MQGGEMHSYCTKGRERREGGSGWVGVGEEEKRIISSPVGSIEQIKAEASRDQT